MHSIEYLSMVYTIKSYVAFMVTVEKTHEFLMNFVTFVTFFLQMSEKNMHASYKEYHLKSYLLCPF